MLGPASSKTVEANDRILGQARTDASDSPDQISARSDVINIQSSPDRGRSMDVKPKVLEDVFHSTRRASNYPIAKRHTAALSQNARAGLTALCVFTLLPINDHCALAERNGTMPMRSFRLGRLATPQRPDLALDSGANSES